MCNKITIRAIHMQVTLNNNYYTGTLKNVKQKILLRNNNTNEKHKYAK